MIFMVFQGLSSKICLRLSAIKQTDTCIVANPQVPPGQFEEKHCNSQLSREHPLAKKCNDQKGEDETEE